MTSAQQTPIDVIETQYARTRTVTTRAHAGGASEVMDTDANVSKTQVLSG